MRTWDWNWTSWLILAAIILVNIVVNYSRRLNKLEVQLAFITARMKYLYQKTNVVYDPVPDVPMVVYEALAAGRNIEAIRLYRQATGKGLKDAKDAIEALMK